MDIRLSSSQLSHLEKGLTALREKRYFDAHEEWEIPWKDMEGDQKLFWQAMIQLSVGAYHYTNNNLIGCRNLWNKGVRKCDRILKNNLVDDRAVVSKLKRILEDCLAAVVQTASPLPMVENAAQHIITKRWLDFE